MTKFSPSRSTFQDLLRGPTNLPDKWTWNICSRHLRNEYRSLIFFLWNIFSMMAKARGVKEVSFRFHLFSLSLQRLRILGYCASHVLLEIFNWISNRWRCFHFLSGEWTWASGATRASVGTRCSSRSPTSSSSPSPGDRTSGRKDTTSGPRSAAKDISGRNIRHCAADTTTTSGLPLSSTSTPRERFWKRSVRSLVIALS